MRHERRAQLLDELVRLAQRWARGRAYDIDRLEQVRGALLADTHARLLADVPVYAKIAGDVAPDRLDNHEVADGLAAGALLGHDVFKGYDPAWLAGDHPALTGWLGEVTRLPAAAATAARRAESLDHWVRLLAAEDVHVVTSASDRMSILARDGAVWRAVRKVNLAVLGPMLISDASAGRLERAAALAAVAALPAHTFARLARSRLAQPRRAAFFPLDFADGTGLVPSLAREAAKLFDEIAAVGRLLATKGAGAVLVPVPAVLTAAAVGTALAAASAAVHPPALPHPSIRYLSIVHVPDMADPGAFDVIVTDGPRRRVALVEGLPEIADPAPVHLAIGVDPADYARHLARDADVPVALRRGVLATADWYGSVAVAVGAVPAGELGACTVVKAVTDAGEAVAALPDGTQTLAVGPDALRSAVADAAAARGVSRVVPLGAPDGFGRDIRDLVRWIGS